ncbi:MAG: serine/threonine-protein kinase [Verrucomicrobiales bacterium]|nr:serine/threonine-protein kinase [Verrucomicrobiales bacterium]
MSFPIPDEKALQKCLNFENQPTYIATGGFKAVYQLKFSDGSADEAIKAVFIPQASSDEESLQRDQLVARAKREIKALNACTHPNIVKLGRVDAEMREIDGSDYLVYSEEFLPGYALDQWLNAGTQVGFDELLVLFESILSLIKDLANLGYLHRDIKPNNIMESNDPNRRFVVLDMGIAYKMEGTQLTQGGNPPGTLRYMAPELLKPDYKDNMDFRCDLYSAGMTVYVLAAGAHPFAPSPQDPYATVYRIINTQPAALYSVRPDLPKAFCQIIDRCIRKRPALRYNTIDLVQTQLGNI